MVTPFAEALGFDDVIATRYEVRDGRYTGRLEGRVRLGPRQAAGGPRLGRRPKGWTWPTATPAPTASSTCPCSPSVGFPHAVNPDAGLGVVATARRWPIEYWDRPPGVPSVVGLEPYHLLRPFVRPEAFPYARFDIAGLEHVPGRGPVLLAANHRSYFDVAALAIVAGRLGRPVRFLAKRELFDAPVVGWVARAIGGIPVDRGSGRGQPLQQAEAALRAGEVVVVLPQGTIPRGERFFDPVLHGRTGMARLAAATGAPVVPVGLVGHRAGLAPLGPGARRPGRAHRRRDGPGRAGRWPLGSDRRRWPTPTAIMAAIAALLPPRRAAPSAEDLARTYPHGQGRQPAAESRLAEGAPS